MEKQTRKRIILYCALFTILVAGLTMILFSYFQRLLYRMALSRNQFRENDTVWQGNPLE